jgi:hypothetical protein
MKFSSRLGVAMGIFIATRYRVLLFTHTKLYAQGRQPARATDARHDAILRSRTYRTTYGRIQTVKNGETRSHTRLTYDARVV